MRVADYIINRLYDEGTKHIFMVTGRGALFLTDAVAAHKEIRGVSMHHEQAAAYAAVAYSDYSESPGVCLVSTGCAGTNAITGVLNAWQDGIPCVFISGQNKLEETTNYSGIPIRTYGQQEANLIPIVSSITKYSVMISDPNRIVYEMEKALHLAQSGRKGPVWIDVPLDIQNMRVDPESLDSFVAEDEGLFEPSKDDLRYLEQAIFDAERPTILIGSGIRSAEAIGDLETFIDNYEIPLTFSGSASDIYGTKKDISIGSVGIMGCSRAGNFTVQNSDLLLVLGCRLSPMTTDSDCSKFARGARVIVVDIDPIEHSKGIVNIDRLIIADVKKVLSALNSKKNKVRKTGEWLERCQHWKGIFPEFDESFNVSERIDLYHLARCLSNELPDESVFVSDSGLIELILPTNIDFGSGQRCIHPASQGSMGFALPGLVGAHFASDLPVISVIGDGSIMMNLQELETIRHNNVPAKIFVINNNAYAVIRKRQVELFRSRTIGVDPSDGVSCPDFKMVAECFGMNYEKIEENQDLTGRVREVLGTEGPVLCEVMGLEDQDWVRSSHTRDSNNRLVFRPLEDQAPYLDRNVFNSEMIVEPIDQ